MPILTLWEKRALSLRWLNDNHINIVQSLVLWWVRKAPSESLLNYMLEWITEWTEVKFYLDGINQNTNKEEEDLSFITK